ncbi:MAG: hypothetical protein KDK37_04530 [Leptospiraceae bacterium]|nr:hypothetical protein [Leptospiraceae bacterium]MCB1303514.1 hypothetical protein [Leptospiraceae bacterium]
MRGSDAPHLLVDFDGVVAPNAVGKTIDFLHRFLNRYRTISRASIQSFVKETVSFPVQDTIAYYFQSLGLTDRLAEFQAAFRKFDADKSSGISIDPGFYRFDQYCKTAGIRFSVLSLASTERLARLKALQSGSIHRFSGSKANPETFVRVLRDLNAVGKRIYYIDDSPIALAAARSSGVITVHMENDVMRRSDATEYKKKIQHRVRSWNGVIRILKESER